MMYRARLLQSFTLLQVADSMAPTALDKLFDCDVCLSHVLIGGLIEVCKRRTLHKYQV